MSHLHAASAAQAPRSPSRGCGPRSRLDVPDAGHVTVRQRLREACVGWATRGTSGEREGTPEPCLRLPHAHLGFNAPVRDISVLSGLMSPPYGSVRESRKVLLPTPPSLEKTKVVIICGRMAAALCRRAPRPSTGARGCPGGRRPRTSVALSAIADDSPAKQRVENGWRIAYLGASAVRQRLPV